MMDGWDACGCQKLRRDPEGNYGEAAFILWEGWHHHFDRRGCHRQSEPCT